MTKQTATDSVTSLQRTLGPLLHPFGLCYSGVMRLREALYEAGAFYSWRPPSLCVSVGNIGWGGTGKTPLVSWLLSWAATRQLRTAVLTRGYRAKPEKYPYPVPPGALAEEAGDEPLMLARQHPEASIVVDPVRMRGGRWAEMNVSPELYILDDGFQHMAVQRDANLVLLRPDDFITGWNRIIPAGSWREGSGALTRADAFLVKAEPDVFQSQAEIIRLRMNAFGKPVFSFSIKPSLLRRLSDGGGLPDLAGESYLLVSGVGEPEQVERTVSRFLGRVPEGHSKYQDHYAYTKQDVHDMLHQADAYGCEHIVCTPKDAVKIGPMASDRFLTLDLGIAFGPSMGAGKSFEQWWGDRYDALYRKAFGQPPAPGRGGSLPSAETDGSYEEEGGYGPQEEQDGSLNVSKKWKDTGKGE